MAIDTRPLRHPEFRRLWSSSLITSVGSQLTAVAVPKQIYDVTGSSSWIGIASISALLLLAAQQGLYGAYEAALGAAIPRLVPAAQLPAANSLNSTVMLTGSLFGPMAAGALIPVVGLPTLYLIDAVGLTATLWAVFRLPALPQLRAVSGTAASGTAVSEGASDTESGAETAAMTGTGRRRATGRTQVAEGFRFAAANRLLLLSFAVDLIAMTFGMPRALFPQMAATTFGGSHLALGLLFASMPAGALAGGLLSGTFTRVRRHGAMTIAAVVAWGLAMFGLGLARSLTLACLFLALGGAADFISMIFRNAILQSVAPDDMSGRMQGVFIVVVAGGPRLADLAHGFAGAALGTHAAVAGGGLAVVVGVLALAITSPAYWGYRAPSP